MCECVCAGVGSCAPVCVRCFLTQFHCNLKKINKNAVTAATTIRKRTCYRGWLPVLEKQTINNRAGETEIHRMINTPNKNLRQLRNSGEGRYVLVFMRPDTSIIDLQIIPQGHVAILSATVREKPVGQSRSIIV